jgi:hypothetical protein
MINSPKFQLWLAIETGRLAVIQSELDQVHVPPEELLIEIRHGGRWVPAPAAANIDAYCTAKGRDT